ncbi:MAG: hypothetical protein KIT69_01845 [Propionibacteriaceae bacterium]|nr:hypothetical protein [Propionibacteriaceae bacterium]
MSDNNLENLSSSLLNELLINTNNLQSIFDEIVKYEKIMWDLKNVDNKDNEETTPVTTPNTEKLTSIIFPNNNLFNKLFNNLDTKLSNIIYGMLETSINFWNSGIIRKGSIDNIFKERKFPENKDQTMQALISFVNMNIITPSGKDIKNDLAIYESKMSILQTIRKKKEQLLEKNITQINNNNQEIGKYKEVNIIANIGSSDINNSNNNNIPADIVLPSNNVTVNNQEPVIEKKRKNKKKKNVNEKKIGIITGDYKKSIKEVKSKLNIQDYELTDIDNSYKLIDESFVEQNNVKLSYKPLDYINIESSKLLLDIFDKLKLLQVLYTPNININKLIFKLMCSIILDPKYSHFILDKNFINYTNRLDNESKKLLYHYMWYPFYILYKEECINRYNINKYDRYVVDVETIKLLPTSTFFKKMIDDENKQIKYKINCNDMYYSTTISEYLTNFDVIFPITSSSDWNVCSLDEIKQRINIFTNNKLTNINWDNVILTGSTICCCVIKNPLEQYYDNFEIYSDKYYVPNNVDIDLAIKSENDEAFMYKAYQIYSDVLKTIPSDQQEEVKLDRVQTKSKFKYVIYGKPIKRNIEMFCIYNKDPTALVAGFHLPCVRAYFDGNNIWAVPSFIIAAKTGLCIDYKWFSCNKRPIDIFLKYYNRGFIPILNPDELKFMRESLNEKDKYLVDLPVQKVGVYNYWFDVPITNSVADKIIQLNTYDVEITKKRKDTRHKYIYTQTEKILSTDTETNNTIPKYEKQIIYGKKNRNEYVKNQNGSINAPVIWKFLSHFN